MTDPNRERLCRAVEALKTLDTRPVFLGGATVGLYLRPEMRGSARHTKDVDTIVPVESQFEWQELETRLRRATFKNDTKIIIRFHHDGDLYDFIPYGEKMSSLLGFDVKFHREAFERAIEIEIVPGCSALVVPLAYLFVTKVCAFNDRGRADPYESKDLEDLVALLMGSNAEAELQEANAAVKETVVQWARRLSADAHFGAWIEGHVPGGPNHDGFVELITNTIIRLRELHS